jgi:phosphatidylglycerophosphatase A
MAILFSTGLGIGYIPYAPGTMASLVALPVGYFLLYCGGTLSLLLASTFILVCGIWSSGVHARSVGHEDPGSSVIDEISGQLLAMLPIVPMGRTSDGLAIAAAFVLFRFFDIAKPWPISRLESLPAGVGIMADDFAAGLVTAVLLFAFLHWGLL